MTLRGNVTRPRFPNIWNAVSRRVVDLRRFYMGCGASNQARRVTFDDGVEAPMSTRSATSDVVRIFSVNDVYKLDNLARLKTCIDGWNAKHGVPMKQYVTVNGDLIGGCLLFSLDKGSSMISVCNEIGVDFLCLGNHEFDHGLAELENRVKQFKGTWLNSNVVVKDEAGNLISSPTSLNNTAPRYHIDTLPNGSKIGFFGVCTTESPSLSLRDPTLEGVVFNDVFESARELLEKELVNVNGVIGVTHLSNIEDEKLLKSNPRINALLGGHDHVAWNCRVNDSDCDRIAVKAGMDSQNVDILEFQAASRNYPLKLLAHKLVVLEEKLNGSSAGYEPDARIAEQIEDHKKILSSNDFSLFYWSEYQADLEEWARKHDPTQAASWTTVEIRARQCNFFSLCAKWLKAEMIREMAANQEKTPEDQQHDQETLEDTIAIANSGNFRSNLDYDFSEKMSFNDVNKELAFNNKVVKVRLPGSDILEMIRNSETERKGQGGYLQYDLDSIEVDFGERNRTANEGISTRSPQFKALCADDISITSINGKVFSPSKLYTTILVGKMLDGMDNWPLLIEHGKQVPNLQSLIDSSQGMGTLVVNHLLRKNWKKLSKLLASESLSDHQTNSWVLSSIENQQDPQSSRVVSIEFVKKAYTEMQKQNCCAAGENTDMAVEAILKMLDSNQDGLVDVCGLAKPVINPRKFADHNELSANMVSWDILRRQDDVATTAAMDALAANDKFKTLAESETKDILDRDSQDAEALKRGIEFAQEKGVLPKIDPAPYSQIDVLGKTADQVADELIKCLGEKSAEGCVAVLVGLSGTGKGTTVDKLKGKLSKAVTWSNGNIFRCLTLLACEYVEKNGAEELQQTLTPENLKSWVERLKFDKFGDKWDIQLTRLDGSAVLVSETANTLLKEPRISKNIPTVASATQGEVVLFAADACARMGQDGSVVIVEGREKTVNFIPTPFRFCLTMSDTSLIGKRRAAQRVVGQALKGCEKDEDCVTALNKCVGTLA